MLFHSERLLHPSVTGPLKALPLYFSNPPRNFVCPSYLNFPQSPLLFKCPPCIILSCPHIILFGVGQKFQNTPQKTAMPPNKFWSPLVLSLSLDKGWIYPLIKFIPGGPVTEGCTILISTIGKHEEIIWGIWKAGFI